MLAWDSRQSFLSWIGAILIPSTLAAVFFLSAGNAVWALACVPLAPLLYGLFMRRYLLRRRHLKAAFPAEWRKILDEHLPYYSRLDAPEKQRFENDVTIFLHEHRITPVSTEIDDEVRVQVASAAVMLIFGRPDWEYPRLPEILIYPRAFDEDFAVTSHRRKRNLSGMVVPQSAIILAKEDLLETAIHEFAHALDMGDGAMEGVPADLHPSAIPEWEELMKEELLRVRRRSSVLDRYAGTNRAELFAVAVEYFFLRPAELRERHEQLYRALSAFFRQDPFL